MKYGIAPSVLAADFLNLASSIDLVNQSSAEFLHVDVMDGVFVPNISFGQSIVKFMHSHSTKPLDVHLMIVDPDRYIQDFKDSGAAILTVHYEACTHLHRTLQAIRDAGMKAGVALNPHTPVSVLKDVLNQCDLICIMSVNPGFGGQKFIERTYQKVSELRADIEAQNLTCRIEIDGGVGLTNAARLIEAGADVLVAGSAVFKAENPIGTIEALNSIV